MFSLKKLRATLAAAVLLLTGHVSTAQAEVTDLWFCNNTGSDVYIAMAYWHYNNNQWQLYAWQKQYPGQCKSIGGVGSGLVYYYAEKEGRRYHWPADAYVDRRYCVPDYGVNRYLRGGGTCPRDERLLGFYGQSVSGSSFTINLNN